jgi:hypothetical protein
MDDDPTMPARPPIAALRAIAKFRDYPVWEAVDLYRDLREALQLPHEYPSSPGLPGSGEPPVQG